MVSVLVVALILLSLMPDVRTCVGDSVSNRISSRLTGQTFSIEQEVTDDVTIGAGITLGDDDDE